MMARSTGRRTVRGVAARVAAVVATIVVVAAGCSDGQVGRSDSAGAEAGYIAGDGTLTTIAPADREAAPDFGGPLLDGGEFRLADAAGEVVVLNVWASWCPPCRKEAPDLQQVSEDLADEGVRFVGVNTKDTDRQAQAYEDEFGITFPSVVDPKGEALLAFRDTMPPGSIPSTIVVDRDGRLAALALGAISGGTLRDIVSDVAAEDATTSGE